ADCIISLRWNSCPPSGNPADVVTDTLMVGVQLAAERGREAAQGEGERVPAPQSGVDYSWLVLHARTSYNISTMGSVWGLEDLFRNPRSGSPPNCPCCSFVQRVHQTSCRSKFLRIFCGQTNKQTYPPWQR
uniref:Uncharacterized protein n=1 Tax=Myripristis murdjan TaxID=586833 RepID=A0A667XLJ0_9TELE